MMSSRETADPAEPQKSEELADVILVTVGIAEQAKGQRAAQRRCQRAAGGARQTFGQLAPSWWRRVELDAGEVAGGGRGVHVLELDGGCACQVAVGGGGRHLTGAGQDHQPEGCLLAQCPQRGGPQLFGDFVQPVQDHRDLACCQQPRAFTAPAFPASSG